MGDYLNNGNKIGTCGNGYYTTLKALELHRGEPEANHYLNPKNKCSFAFPYPKYDGKKAGEISQFHEGERSEFIFTVPSTVECFHEQMSHHLHPKGGEGINVFYPCPYMEGAHVSTNFNKSNVRFRLMYQRYYNESLHITADCIYCGCSNIFSAEEAEIIVENERRQLDKLRADIERKNRSVYDYEKQDAEQLQRTYDFNKTVLDRIEATYTPVTA